MKELYVETKALLVKKEIFFEGDLATSTLSWWWALWLLNNFAGQIVFRYSLHAESLEELNTSAVLSMFSNMIGIPLALLAIKVIKDYATVESLLHQVTDEPKEITNTLNYYQNLYRIPVPAHESRGLIWNPVNSSFCSYLVLFLEPTIQRGMPAPTPPTPAKMAMAPPTAWLPV